MPVFDTSSVVLRNAFSASGMCSAMVRPRRFFLSIVRGWTGSAAHGLTAAAKSLGQVLRAFGAGAVIVWDGGENPDYADNIRDGLKNGGGFSDVATPFVCGRIQAGMRCGCGPAMPDLSDPPINDRA
jgi:hypothetical protein